MKGQRIFTVNYMCTTKKISTKSFYIRKEMEEMYVLDSIIVDFMARSITTSVETISLLFSIEEIEGT